MSLSKTDFANYASRGFNRIPLMREVLADLDTPLSVYLKLARGPYSYLFESVQGGEKWGRYSIIGLPARTLLRVAGNEVSVEKDGQVLERETVADPLDYVRRFKARYRVPEIAGLPRFTGGLVGYFGYETIRYVEPRLGKMAKPDAIGAPDILLMVSDEVVVFDNLKGKLYVVIHVNPEIEGAYDKANARLDELVMKLDKGVLHDRPAKLDKTVSEADFVSSFTREGYESAVRRIKEYVAQGDVMQVVPSQRMSIPYSAAPLDLYRALRTLNPSPYMFFMDLKDFHIVGSSPEILVRLEDGLVTVRPIAGTRPRGATDAEDRAMEIIEELEPVRRGVYAGAVGYIGWSGNMDTAIAIRTAVIKDGTLYIQAGGGIVADSVPSLEWEETLNKRRAMFRAVAMASAGLNGPQGG